MKELKDMGEKGSRIKPAKKQWGFLVYVKFLAGGNAEMVEL